MCSQEIIESWVLERADIVFWTSKTEIFKMNIFDWFFAWIIRNVYDEKQPSRMILRKGQTEWFAKVKKTGESKASHVHSNFRMKVVIIWNYEIKGKTIL